MEGRGRKTYSTVIPSKSKNEKTEFDGSWQVKKVICFKVQTFWFILVIVPHETVRKFSLLVSTAISVFSP